MLAHTALKQTPLYQEHVHLNARIIPFGGWEMPVQYEGILSEYEQCRKSASLFDTCHMGEFFLEGNYKECGLDFAVTQRLDDMPEKSCRYGTMLNKNGGIVDDLIVYRIEEEKWMIVANGGTIEKDEQNFLSHLSKDAFFKNISSETGKLDIQGPLAREILKEIIPGIEKLDYYTFDYFEVLEHRVIVSRTGYTGELGYEIYFPWNEIENLWMEILKNEKIKPAGLGARDVLRLEMGYSLYGNDLDDGTSPLEAGLEKFVDYNKDFAGKEALLAQKSSGVKRKMVSFISESRRSPRHGQTLYLDDATAAGVVTSGTFSPALKKGIGMGFVNTQCDLKSKKIFFGDDKAKEIAALVLRPFYKQGSVRS